MRRLALAAAAVSWLAVVPSAPAHAATSWVTFAIQNRFLPGDLTIAPGDTLTLVNLESSPHDVWSDLTGPSGPLFHSETLYNAGESAPVVGVSSLEPGAYGFYCSVHEDMRGSIVVA